MSLRRKNIALRTREHLTPFEVEKLFKAATSSRIKASIA
jgi:hypothetical protein